MLNIDGYGDAGGEFAPPRAFNVCPDTGPTATQPPETRLVEPRADRDRTGLWGLLGLAGLLGLTGLGRRREDVRISTDPRERSRV